MESIFYTDQERCVTIEITSGKTFFSEDHKEALNKAKERHSYTYEVYTKQRDDFHFVGWAVPK